MGGPAAITADPEQLRDLARRLRAAADLAIQAAGSVHRGLSLGDLALAAAFDPAGAVAFEAAAMRVLLGPFGLRALEHELDELGCALSVAAEDYVATEQHIAADLARAIVDGPVAGARAVPDLIQGNLLGALSTFLTSDPAVIDLVAANDLPAPVLHALGELYPDGRPRVTDLGPALTPVTPPRDVHDLMTTLGQLDDTRPAGQGEIEVQILIGTDAAGHRVRRAIVLLPGTDNWSLNPTSADVDNLGTDVRALAGENTTYERGVLAAMHAAGIPRTDDVMIIGHSLGGMIAVNTARDAAQSGEFTITHVVAAGSPVGHLLTNLPASTRALAVENRGDLVPHLDGTGNPRRANVATITINDNHDRIGPNHHLDTSYAPGAGQVDASTDPAVRSYIDSARGFFTLDSVTTERYGIVRVLN